MRPNSALLAQFDGESAKDLGPDYMARIDTSYFWIRGMICELTDKSSANFPPWCCRDGKQCCPGLPCGHRGVCLSDGSCCKVNKEVKCCLNSDCNATKTKPFCNLATHRCEPEPPTCQCVSPLVCVANRCVVDTPVCELNDCCTSADCRADFVCSSTFNCEFPETPIPDDPCLAGNCSTAGVAGDPHLVTFDGVQYSCQGGGDFIVMQSPGGLAVHAHFKKKSALVSLATAVAVRGGPTESKVEVVIPDSGGAVQVLVNDASDVVLPFDEDDVALAFSGSTYYVFVKSSGAMVRARQINAGGFQHFDVRVTVPRSFGTDRGMVGGLLGSPDGAPENDWMASNGTPLIIPFDKRGRPAFEYCLENWCIRDESLSLISHDESMPFVMGCDEAYPGSVDTASAPEWLVELCGTDEACLIDGMELGQEGAQSLLESQSEMTARELLVAIPDLIVAGVSTAVSLNLDLSRLSEVPDGLDGFAIYRLDPATLNAGTTALLRLRDVGSGIGLDTDGDDLVFANSLSLLADTAGMRFGFQAVPMINGVADPSSPLVFSSANVVRSYSAVSGIGGGQDGQQILRVESIDKLLVIVKYSWSKDQTDLDTGTAFLGAKVGYLCGNTGETMNFSGDDTSVEGDEVIMIRLGQTYKAGNWRSTTLIGLHAGWFHGLGSGPATVTVQAAQAEDGSWEATPLSRTLTFAINPLANQDGCSSFKVGTIAVEVRPTGRVIIAAEASS